MLEVIVEPDRVSFDDRLSIVFQRTVRIPDDDRTYNLPAGLGSFPILRVADYAERLPPEWKQQGGVFIPMYQHEALWIAFIGLPWRPSAIKIGLGSINAISGTGWDPTLSGKPQNYVVHPEQFWIDGIKVADGAVRQFVALPLGQKATIESQLSTDEGIGGLRIMVFAPKPGRISEQPLPGYDEGMEGVLEPDVPQRSMGLAVGGKIQQKMYPDRFGVDTWDPQNYGEVFVHILNSQAYSEVTGHAPPPTPITLDTYEKAGIPWFKLSDVALADIPAAERLARLKPAPEPDKAKRGAEQSGQDEVGQ
jgi:hypothetical protein